MARIDALPSIDIIRGYKGVIDFYIWRGLACARAWPRYRPARQTAASLAAALLFGAIIKSYSQVQNDALTFYQEDAADQPRSARDLMVTGVFGNLHEASMSDFLDLLTDCRDFLAIMVSLVDALHSIDTDELVVRVEHSVLPDDAATAAAQATQLTALQKIDDLQDALESKALDRFLVRGSDQLFSFKAPLANANGTVISGAGGWCASDPVPEGEIWLVTSICAWDGNNPTTKHVYQVRHDGISYYFGEKVAAFPTGGLGFWDGLKWLDYQDTIRVWFTGALAGDTCYVVLTGHAMTAET